MCVCVRTLECVCSLRAVCMFSIHALDLTPAQGMAMEAWQRSPHASAYFFSSCAHSAESEACITPGVYAVIGYATRLSVGAA